jgi:hypothetical protein
MMNSGYKSVSFSSAEQGSHTVFLFTARDAEFPRFSRNFPVVLPFDDAVQNCLRAGVRGLAKQLQQNASRTSTRTSMGFSIGRFREVVGNPGRRIRWAIRMGRHRKGDRGVGGSGDYCVRKPRLRRKFSGWSR